MQSPDDSEPTKAMEDQNKAALDKARSLVDELRTVQEHEANLIIKSAESA
jgi:hypothetical protein